MIITKLQFITNYQYLLYMCQQKNKYEHKKTIKKQYNITKANTRDEHTNILIISYNYESYCCIMTLIKMYIQLSQTECLILHNADNGTQCSHKK